MSSSDSEMSTSDHEANTVTENHLPEVSKERYLNMYNDFMKWRTEKKIESFSESVFLTYFNELAKKMLPSTLWSKYSMLKSTVSAKHNVNFKKFHNLTSFLKKQSQGFKSKKSKVFTYYEVEKFLNEAPDEIYLAVKVALILGISGACRGSELTNLSINDVQKHDQLLLLKLPKTQTTFERSFVVRDEFAHIVKKYQKLRPKDIKTDRFFLNYQKGKIHKQVIGKNKISSMPKQIAKYLNLPNCDQYTGHCFRRTSETLFSGSRAKLTKLKSHEKEKSNIVAEQYIEVLFKNETKISNNLTKTMKPTNSPEQTTSEQSPLQTSPCSNETIKCSNSPEPATSEQSPSRTSPYSSETIKQERNSPEPTTSEQSLPWTSSDERPESPMFIDFQQNQIYHNISNSLNIPSKNLTLNFTNCSNFSINFK